MTPQSNLGREDLKTRFAIQVGEIDVGNVSDVVGTRLVTTDSLKIIEDFSTYIARPRLDLRVIVHLLDMPKVAKISSWNLSMVHLSACMRSKTAARTRAR